MAFVELVLHNAYTTGTIEVFPQSQPDWISLTLPSPMAISDALAYWASAIQAIEGAVTTWVIVAGQAQLVSDPMKLRLTPTLGALLGYAVLETSTFQEEHFGTITPRGFAELPVGNTLPMDVEQAELEAFRAGRAVGQSYGRAIETTLDFFWSAEQFALLERGALLSGHGARRITRSTTDEFAEGTLDGRLLVFPVETTAIEREAVEGFVRVSVRCSMLDPGSSPPVLAPATRWGQMMAAVRHGFAPYYELVVEGIPVLFCELIADLEAPSGYTLDASLVIDRSARLGPALDEETHFSKAFDLSALLMDTPAVRGLVRTPTVVEPLLAPIEVGDVLVSVPTPSAFEVGDILQVDHEAMEVTSIGTTSVGVSRGTWGRARTHAAGVEVSTTPLLWDGRRARLVTRLLDPTGRFVPGVTCVRFEGHVLERPDRDGVMWTLTCRDQVRRLTDPLGVAASGVAAWALQDDLLVSVDNNLIVDLRVEVFGGPQGRVQFRPFLGAPNRVLASEMRRLVAEAAGTALAGLGGPGGFGTPFWRIARNWRGVREYQLWVPATSTAVTSWGADCRARLEGIGNYLVTTSLALGGGPAGGTADVPLGLSQPARVLSADLQVTLDKVAGSELPPGGWVKLEGNGVVGYRKYVGVEVDSDDPQRVTLELDPSYAPAGDELQAMVSAEGDADRDVSLTVTFYWSDTGHLRDVVRRAIASSGDGVNGTFDTLPRGQGLDLPAIDEASFVRVFDGAFRGLTFDLRTESGTSLQKLLGGVLRLSRRALTSRMSADGSAVQIAAVNVGSADAGVPTAQITDRVLVASQGRRPCRRLKTFGGPRAIEVKTHVLPIGGTDGIEGSFPITAPGQRYWTSRRWELEVHGLTRDQVFRPATTWAAGWFRVGRTRQSFEVDVDPTVECQMGDVVWCDLSDPQVWEYADDEPGYVGFARVLGQTFNLQTGVQTVQLEGDGQTAAGPMSPSIPILAVNGTATAPTSIDVPLEWKPLLERARNGGFWFMLAYLPGQDSGRAGYVLGAVTEVGGVCRLAVFAAASSPTVTLTTAYRLTYPDEPSCTPTQAVHLHGRDGTQWT